MEGKRQEIPEALLRVMALRFLDSRYPTKVEYNELEKVMEAIDCSPRRLARVLAYLGEKEFVEGVTKQAFQDEYLEWVTVKITAEGIDYLEQLEEEIREQVEKKETEIGFQPYSRQQGKKNK